MLRRCCCLCARRLVQDNASTPACPVASTSKAVVNHALRPRSSLRKASHAARSFSVSNRAGQTSELLLRLADGDQTSAPSSYWKGKGKTRQVVSEAGLQAASKGSGLALHPSREEQDTSISQPPEITENISSDGDEKLPTRPERSASLLGAIEVLQDSIARGQEIASEDVQWQIPLLALPNELQSQINESLYLSLSLQSAIVKVLYVQYASQAAHDSYKTQKKALRRSLGILFSQAGNSAAVPIGEAMLSEFLKRKRWRPILDLGELAHSSTGYWSDYLLSMYLQAIDQTDQYHLTPSTADLCATADGLSSNTLCLLLKLYLAGRKLDEVKALLGLHRSSLGNRMYWSLREGYRKAGLSGAHDMPQLLQEMSAATMSPAVEVLEGLITAMIEHDELAEAHEFMSTISPVIKARGEVRTLLPADTTRQSIPITNHAPPPDAVVTTIAGQDSVQASLLPRPTPSIIAAFAAGYARLGDLDRALDFYVEMLEQGSPPSSALRHALLQAYTSTLSPPPDAAAVLGIERLAEDSVATTSDGQARGATALWDGLKDSLRSQGLPGAILMLKEAKLRAQPITTTAVKTLLSYLSGSQQIPATTYSRIMSLLRKSASSPHSIQDLNVLLTALFQKENGSRHSRSRRSGPDPPHAVFSPTIDPEMAASLASALGDLRLSDSRPDSRTIALLMHRYAKNGGSPAALWAFFRWQILDQGLEAAPQHILAIMQAYLASGDQYGARRAMDRAQGLGITPSLHMHALLFQDFLAKNQLAQARAMVEQLRAKGFNPDLHFYTIQAHWAATKGHIEQIVDVLVEVKRQLPAAKQPNVVLETAVFIGFTKKREFRTAQERLDEMLHDGLVPDRKLLVASLRNIQNLRREVRRAASSHHLSRQLERTLNQAVASHDRLKRIYDQAGRPYAPTDAPPLDRKAVAELIETLEHD